MADLLSIAIPLLAVWGVYGLIVRQVRRREGIPPRHEQLVRDALASDLHGVFEEGDDDAR